MFSRLKTIQVNYPICFGVAYLIKTLALPVTVADSIIFVGMLSLIGFNKYLKFKEPKVTPFDEFKAKVEEQNKVLIKAVEECAYIAKNAAAKVDMSHVGFKTKVNSQSGTDKKKEYF